MLAILPGIHQKVRRHYAKTRSGVWDSRAGSIQSHTPCDVGTKVRPSTHQCPARVLGNPVVAAGEVEGGGDDGEARGVADARQERHRVEVYPVCVDRGERATHTWNAGIYFQEEAGRVSLFFPPHSVVQIYEAGGIGAVLFCGVLQAALDVIEPPSEAQCKERLVEGGAHYVALGAGEVRGVISDVSKKFADAPAPAKSPSLGKSSVSSKKRIFPSWSTISD
ncbi:hypothetical protein DFH08DRAFT_986626 [Mycena albidolilacea]|uniref:Uncharacterized protein n=1 Tax=Mycena albidolilacea TaxID=1033008 RepID=A0AAD7E9B5_9AGAR|nr:hypothetical protein DFH08DRAFT_986626 [Mycena albidolilacea]